MYLHESNKADARKLGRGPTPTIPDDDLLSEDVFAKKIGRTVATLRTWRARRKGPPYITFARKTWYRWSAYLKMMVALEREAEQSRPARRRAR
jgi:hypothetical protein